MMIYMTADQTKTLTYLFNDQDMQEALPYLEHPIPWKMHLPTFLFLSATYSGVDCGTAITVKELSWYFIETYIWLVSGQHIKVSAGLILQ